jgi:putative NADH-flavin reductase
VRLAVFGGTGRVGSRLVAAARGRGHRVASLVREAPSSASSAEWVVGDVLDPAAVRRIIASADAVVSVLGVANFRDPGTLLADGMRVITMEMQRLGVARVVALAGAGILDAADGGLRQDRPGFPDAFRPISAAHRDTWEVLAASGLDWTLVCTGDQVPGGDPARVVSLVDQYPDATNQVGIDDIGAFMLDRAGDRQFAGHRVGLGWRRAG